MDRCDYTSHKTEYIGFSTDTKKTEGIANGSTYHEVDTDKKFIFYCGTWYPTASFNSGGGGNSDGVLEFEAIDETGRIQLNRSLSAQDVSFPIAGHDAFYQPQGYGMITRIPFDAGTQTQFQAVCTEDSQCWITHMAYGNGVYFGVSTTRGRAYKSEDAVNWEVVYDFQIDPAAVTSISFSGGDFFFGTSTGVLGIALKSEDYHRVADYSSYYMDVTNAGVLQMVHGHFGSHFFVTDTCIVSGHLGGGEIRRLAFLEEASDEQYLATTIAFWNNQLVMFNNMERLIYTMQMRFPHDTGGNFIDPEWHFYHDDNWQNESYPVGVTAYGENLIVFTDRNIYCIDRNGNIAKMNDEDISVPDVHGIVTADKTILVWFGSSAYQFFIK